jgi:3-oxoacyl-(acyl-carrier-protein) synthase
MEYVAMSAVFPDEGKRVSVSSTKSMIGHTLSAAGTSEAAFSLMMLENQRLLPTINYRKPDPAIPLDVVPNSTRDARLSYAMSNSFGSAVRMFRSYSAPRRSCPDCSPRERSYLGRRGARKSLFK